MLSTNESFAGVSSPLIENTLEFRNITYKRKCGANKGDILKAVNGEFKSGRLVGILGPSGSGKTTLLNILSGFKTEGVTGVILFNGEKQKISEFRQKSSYIPQEFQFLDNLTTRETLQFSAELKISKASAKKSKDIIVQNILDTLNLNKCSQTLVGKLSGGEKKRLASGVELVTNPPVMLFDEPTSGLDSVSVFQVLTYLRNLAHNGRIIVCAIHHPSSRVLQLFDDMLILSEGRCIYLGPLTNLVKVFEEGGFVCPNYYNPADYAIEVASKEHGNDLSVLLAINERLSFNSYTREILDDCEKQLLSPIVNSFSRMIADSKNIEKKYSVGFLKQFNALTLRSITIMRRDLICVQLRITMHILIGFLLSAVYWDIGNEGSKILSNTSCIFFFLIFVFFGNAMPTVVSCPLETSVFLREHLNGWYSIKAYYLSKFVSDLPLQIICPTVFTGIGYFLTGQPKDLERFLMFWAIVALTSILGQTFGLLAGSAFHLQLAVFLVPASCIPMLIFSGFFIRLNELPEYLKSLSHVSYFRYSLEGSIQAIYGFNRTDLLCSETFCYYKNPVKFLKDMGMYGDRYGTDIIALLLWIIVLQALLYLSLVFKVKRCQ